MEYTYNPANITIEGKDKMRFELGDTLTDGGAMTCALSDEEYSAIIDNSQASWEHTKLKLLKAICMKMSYQVNQKIANALEYSFSDRARAWRQMCDDLERKLSKRGAPMINKNVLKKPPAFYDGLHDNERVFL